MYICVSIYYFNEELDEVPQMSIKFKSRVKSKCLTHFKYI